MVISSISPKGQIVIPAALRRKYHIHQGMRMAVSDGDGQIIIKPVPDNPIEAASGFLKKLKGPSAFKVFMQERRKERSRK